MKCKIFEGYKFPELEAEINEWLAKHSIYIYFITQSQDAGTEDVSGYVVISVWYTETK